LKTEFEDEHSKNHGREREKKKKWRRRFSKYEGGDSVYQCFVKPGVKPGTGKTHVKKKTIIRQKRDREETGVTFGQLYKRLRWGVVGLRKKTFGTGVDEWPDWGPVHGKLVGGGVFNKSAVTKGFFGF